MQLKRVVITGMGAITPLGLNVQEFWNKLKTGQSGISKIERFDTTDFGTKIAGEIKNFVVEDYIDKKLASRMDLFCQFGVATARAAIKDARLDVPQNLNLDRIGVVVGSGIGGLQTFEDNSGILLSKGPRRVSPMFVPMSILDMISGYISMEYGYRGPNYAITSACATGPHSIMSGFNHIRLGEADIMIAGGGESTVTQLGMAGFIQARALSSNFNDTPELASRPFDKDRDGFVMAEGAGILVLEEYEHAIKRGAKIYGEMLSYGATADAYHITAPHPEGLGASTAMDIAIKNAGIKTEDIDLINMHGTSTPLGDIAETQAIKKTFGEHAYKLYCNSTKSMSGHALGAAGAMEAIAIMKMMEESVIHPTINIFNQDPECDLNYTANIAVNKELNYVLSNSFGFGGHNVSLVFKKI
ncbi:MAG: beta-ketoacyl-ACP synthase II [Brevinema sp.]